MTLQERQAEMKARMHGQITKARNIRKRAQRSPMSRTDPFAWPAKFTDVSIEHAIEVAKKTFMSAKPEDDPFVMCNKWLILSLIRFIEGAPCGKVRQRMQANLKRAT